MDEMGMHGTRLIVPREEVDDFFGRVLFRHAWQGNFDQQSELTLTLLLHE